MTIQKNSQGEANIQFGSAIVKLISDGFEVGTYRIQSPGEFDIEGVGFEVGIGYGLIHGEGMRILVIESSHEKLSSENIAALEDIQLVVIPAESDLNRAKLLTGLIHDLEPRGVVVLGCAEECKILTGHTIEPTQKIKITTNDLSGEDLRVWSVV